MISVNDQLRMVARGQRRSIMNSASYVQYRYERSSLLVARWMHYAAFYSLFRELMGSPFVNKAPPIGPQLVMRQHVWF